jgi:outer membrane lipoprotein SlyB
MKTFRLVTLMTVLALGLAACSSATPEPGADTSAAAPASSNATATAPAAAPKPAPTPPPAPKMITVPAGTELEVVLVNALSSDKSNAGDSFEATLAAPLVIEGAPVLEKGSTFHGHVVAAEGSGRVKGLASLSLVLTDVVHDGKTTPIATKDWAVKADTTKKKDATKVGIGAAVGTAIGAIAGGGSGAAKGAAIGGGAGAGVVLATKGKEIELGAEDKLKFTLEKSVEFAAKKG